MSKPKSVWQVVDQVLDLIGLINLPLVSTEVLLVVEAPAKSGESVDEVLPVLRQLLRHADPIQGPQTRQVVHNQRADGVWQLLAEVIQQRLLDDAVDAGPRKPPRPSKYYTSTIQLI